MRATLTICATLLTLSGCQTPAPQSVVDSQRPPSGAVRHEVVKVAREAGIKPGALVSAQISSVVLLTPETQIYAFCVRGVDKKDLRGNAQYLGIALRNGKIVDSTVNDYRCRDKRLRYFDFPELISLKG